MDPCKETITVPVASPRGASRNSFPGMTDIGETPPAPNLFNFCVLCSHADVRQTSLAEEETAGGDVCFCCGASSGAHSGDAQVPAQPASPGQGGPGRCWAEAARPLVSPSVRSHFALLELSQNAEVSLGAITAFQLRALSEAGAILLEGSLEMKQIFQ